MATAAGTKARSDSSKRPQRSLRADRRAKRRHLLAASLLAFCLVGAILLHVWLRLQVVHMGYVLSTASKLHNQLEQEKRQLKVEMATLTSPDRLEAMARKRLQLMTPGKGQVIVLP